MFAFWEVEIVSDKLLVLLTGIWMLDFFVGEERPKYCAMEDGEVKLIVFLLLLLDILYIF